MKLFLTAPPGVGKSTIIDTVVREYPGKTRGIVAREVLNAEGKRQGFTSYNAACESRQFMFLAEPGKGAVGDFSVDVQAIDEFVVPELRAALSEDGLVYADEIGRAQAKSAAFLAVLRDLVRSPKALLASIVYDDEPWSMEFKTNPHVCILEVNVQNRNALPAIVLAAFAHTSEFARLNKDQQTTTQKWLKKLVDEGHYVAARKLFDNALCYVTENKIAPQGRSTAGGERFEVAGKTRAHVIERQADGSFICDCDLSNGRGDFTHAEPCSHQLSLLISRVAVQQS